MENDKAGCPHFWAVDTAGKNLVVCTNCRISKTLNQLIDMSYKAGLAATPEALPWTNSNDSPAKIAFDFLPIGHDRHKAKLENRIIHLLLNQGGEDHE